MSSVHNTNNKYHFTSSYKQFYDIFMVCLFNHKSQKCTRENKWWRYVTHLHQPIVLSMREHTHTRNILHVLHVCCFAGYARDMFTPSYIKLLIGFMSLFYPFIRLKTWLVLCNKFHMSIHGAHRDIDQMAFYAATQASSKALDEPSQPI